MTDTQREGLGTARAFYDAGNTEGAERILGQLLEQNPDDFPAATLKVEMLQKQGQHAKALKFCDTWLSKHPNSTAMHVNRFVSLGHVGSKKEMNASLKQFRENFPHHRHAIGFMETVLNARGGKLNEVRKTIQAELHDESSPHRIRAKGIALHNIKDFFEAEHYLAQALEHFPNDARLLEVMATNRFQIGRLASARAFAARGLAADPTKRRLAFLSRATWLFYYPSFYILLIMFSTSALLYARLNKPLALVVFLVLFLQIGGAASLLNYPMVILLGIGWSQIHMVLILICAVGYFVSTHERYFETCFGRKKPVKLKNY